MTDHMVEINGRTYGRVIYSDGSAVYGVFQERRNRFGLRIFRTLNGENIKRKIDNAINKGK